MQRRSVEKSLRYIASGAPLKGITDSGVDGERACESASIHETPDPSSEAPNENSISPRGLESSQQDFVFPARRHNATKRCYYRFSRNPRKIRRI